MYWSNSSMANKNPHLKKIKNDFIYFFIVMLITWVRLVPRTWSLFVARRLAALCYHLMNGERRKAEMNLDSVYGHVLTVVERRMILKAVFVNLAQNLVDAILMKKRLQKNPDEAMSLTGLEEARAAQAKGKGIIFLTAHTGCFEMLSPRFSRLGFQVSVLGTKIYDPRLNTLIVENRQTFDVEYIERGDDLRALLKSLHSGHSFGVLCDLDTRVESRFVDFFGKLAKTPVGPFKLGVKFDIPLIPVFAQRTPAGGQSAVIYPEIVPEGATAEEKMVSTMCQYNKLLEEFIRRDPAQWIWMHERWKSRP